VSIQDIRLNPQDTSNFYLANIYQTVSDRNKSNISSSLHTSPPTFSPPNYAVWVNSLWFLSLVISLTCALLATLLQQWHTHHFHNAKCPHTTAEVPMMVAVPYSASMSLSSAQALTTSLPPTPLHKRRPPHDPPRVRPRSRQRRHRLPVSPNQSRLGDSARYFIAIKPEAIVFRRYGTGGH